MKEKKTKETVEAEIEKDEDLLACEERYVELEEKFLRLQAEFENYKRRMQCDLEGMASYGACSIVTDLLPVLDNFSRALAHKPEEKESAFYQGVEMIERQLLDSLEARGLEKIEAVGNPFDPEYHEGVMNEPVEDEDQVGLVLDELQPGYLFNKKVIRPSMVKVGVQ